MSLEWDVTTIGELCSNVSSGGTPKSTNEEYYGGNIPWLNTKEINFNRIYDTEKHITNEGFKNSAAKWVKKDSVIVAMYGATAAKVAMNMVDLTTNQACCNLTIDKSLANPKFVYYYLYSNYERLLNLASGAAQQNLNSNIIKEFPINIPSLNVQNEIVNLLSTIDDKIELNQKVNKNLEATIKSIFNNWFVDYDFLGYPEFNVDEFQSSELGEIPNGWAVKSLDDDLLESLESGKRPKGGISDINEGIPSIGAENILGLGKFDYSKNKLISYEFFNKMKKGKIKDKDVLLYKDGAQLGRKSLFMKGFPFETCCINEHVFILRTNSNLSPYYLYFWLDQDWMTNEIINLNSNSAQPGINQKDVKSLPILIPSDNIMDKFHEIVSPGMEIIFDNALEIKKLSQLRDTLLPKLMSGEIDVSEINCDLE